MNPAHLSLSVSSGGGQVVVALEGDIEASNAALLRRTLADLLDTHPGDDLALDVRGVRYVDSAGLGVLTAANRRAMEHGRALSLCNVGRSFARVLEVTGLDEVLVGVPGEQASGQVLDRRGQRCTRR